MKRGIPSFGKARFDSGSPTRSGFDDGLGRGSPPRLTRGGEERCAPASVRRDALVVLAALTGGAHAAFEAVAAAIGEEPALRGGHGARRRDAGPRRARGALDDAAAAVALRTAPATARERGALRVVARTAIDGAAAAVAAHAAHHAELLAGLLHATRPAALSLRAAAAARLGRGARAAAEDAAAAVRPGAAVVAELRARELRA